MFRVPPVLAVAGIQALETASGVAGRVIDRLDEAMPVSVFRGLVETTSPTISIGAGQLFGVATELKNCLRRSAAYQSLYFSQFPKLFEHPLAERLLELVLQPTTEGPDGFPRISQATFRSFVDGVPHLFADGEGVLQWLAELENALESRPGLDGETRASIGRAVDAFRTITFTASVTAPPDLWLMRQILATHENTGVLDLWERRETLTDGDARLLDLDGAQFSFDAQFLEARGVLEGSGDGYSLTAHARRHLLRGDLSLDSGFRTDLTGLMVAGFSAGVLPEEESLIGRWLLLPPVSRQRSSAQAWIASRHEMEVGYRVVPIVLALKASGLLKDLRAGSTFPETRWGPAVRHILNEAGYLKGSRVTALGARAFERGPGVYGIIGAYYPYLNQHAALLKNGAPKPHVERGRNIVASRDANRKSFQTVVEIIKAAGLNPRVIMEHAVGLGIGLQEFLKEFGDQGRQFIAVDYEEAALKGTRREMAEGRLPEDTLFLQADIAKPDMFLKMLKEKGVDPSGAVMIVGNGFHEARGLSDSEMIAILRRYREAGIIIVFTEESGLTRRQIRNAAWNTYNAGFLYTHRISGQVPRAPWPMDPPSDRLSWTELFEQSDYRVPPEFRRGSRNIFPCSLSEATNPPISVTFLCLP